MSTHTGRALGRPPKGYGRARTECWRVRLTGPESAAVAAAAARHDLSRADVIRCALRQLLKTPEPPDRA